MANYDQSGNPVSGSRQQQGGQGQSGTQPGGWQGRSAQQSQFSGGAQGNASANASRPQFPYGTGNSRAAGPGMSQYGAGPTPGLYSGFGPGGPFQLISRLSEEMDRLFEGFGLGSAWPTGNTAQGRGQSGSSGQGVRAMWTPHIEVAERDGKLLIQADLPGVRKDDVDVQIQDDAVIIQGQRQQQSERNEHGFFHSERTYGSFYRVIPLPEGVDPEQANATFRDGVLHIELKVPQQQQRARRLEIRDGASDAPQHAEPGSGSGAGAQQQPQGSPDRR